MVHAMVEDAILWFGIRGRISKKESARMRRELTDVYQTLVRDSIQRTRPPDTARV
jgi:hypothetical protein